MQKIPGLFSLLVCQILALTFLVIPVANADSFRLVSHEYPPYEYTEDGVIKGIAVEVIKETFKLMNHQVRIEIYPWARSIEMLKNGEADAIFPIFKTPQDDPFTFYSNEMILSQKISLWVKKESKLGFNGELAGLHEHRIGVVRKLSYGGIFDTAVKNGSIAVSESYTSAECIHLLTNNRIDIWVSNYLGAVFELNKSGQHRNVQELLPAIEDVPTYIGFSKKNKLAGLRDEFDKAFIELKETGKYRNIIERYGN